jgi:Uma2 family endonuclease
MVAQTEFRSDESFTQKEFRRWVDARPGSDINRYELIHGRIVMTPPASWTHSGVASMLVQIIGRHVRNRRLGYVFESSAGYDLPSGDTVEPDVSFVSTQRFARQSPHKPHQFLRVVPNLVIEILSPATAKRDRTEKKAIYEENGVDEYWIVDTREKVVTVFALQDRKYEAGRTFRSGTIRSRALPGLRLSVERVFEI